MLIIVAFVELFEEKHENNKNEQKKSSVLIFCSLLVRCIFHFSLKKNGILKTCFF